MKTTDDLIDGNALYVIALPPFMSDRYTSSSLTSIWTGSVKEPVFRFPLHPGSSRLQDL